MNRRRGFSLVQLLALLPVIAVVFALCFELSNQVLSLQCRESRQMSDDACLGELVRRVQRDAGQADSASIEQIDGNTRLQLNYADKVVLYEAVEGGVTRTERQGSVTAHAEDDNASLGGMGKETGGMGKRNERSELSLPVAIGDTTSTTGKFNPDTSGSNLPMPPMTRRHKSVGPQVWTMPSVQAAFQIEQIGQKAEIVWIRLENRILPERGPALIRPISAAATVGRGGRL